MKKILLWILVISWMCLIFYFSQQDSVESTNQSRGFIDKTNIIEKYDDKTDAEKEQIMIGIDAKVRKIAHAGVFLVLGVLVCFLVKEFTLDIKKILIISFIICMFYACSDEIHQLYVPGRSGELKDIVIDSLGLLTGEMIFYLSGIKIWKRVKND